MASSSSESRWFLDLLLAGNREEAVRSALGVFQDRGVRHFYEDVITPAMAEVGARWEQHDIGVAEEHIASAIVGTIIGAISPRLPWSKGGPHALVACVEGERHDLGARIFADLLALEGWNEVFMGADVPNDDLVRKAAEWDPVLIALSMTTQARVPTTRALVKTLREELDGEPHIVIGGHAAAKLRSDEATIVHEGSAAEAVQRVAPWKGSSAAVEPARVARRPFHARRHPRPASAHPHHPPRRRAARSGSARATGRRRRHRY